MHIGTLLLVIWLIIGAIAGNLPRAGLPYRSRRSGPDRFTGAECGRFTAASAFRILKPRDWVCR